MQCKHVKTLIPGQDGIARIQAMCWSPNNKRFAVADAARFVSLFDEGGERRDKFGTKPADPKTAKTYAIRDMSFSPDSVKLALAQSDYALFVYRLGAEWGEKKSICNKFLQNSAVSCLTWPIGPSNGDVIAFGTDEGKVKVAILKTNKAQTLYGHEAAVISIASSIDGNSIVSGHLDGAIFRFTFEGDDGTPASHAKIVMHPCEPYCLVWGEHIAAAGSNCVMIFYDRTGRTLQSFDYETATERDFTCAAVNPSGHTVAVGAADKIRLFNFSLRSRKWEEGNVVALPNSYSFSRVTWKFDGSRLVTGSLTGAVDVFDACLRRYRLRDAFEFTYVSHNQVIVKRLATGTRIALKSSMGYEIQKVNVHQDRYLVAHTSTTVLIGDLGTCRLSEIPWQMSGREKFVFDDPHVCMIFAAGELSLVEYGKNEVLGTCRTEQTNRHRISVRVHEPPAGATTPGRKCIAYLVDRETVEVIDLVTGLVIAHIPHTNKIDWLELNHRATRLLFRDKQRQLFLYDLVKQTKHTLLNYCSYVQWVPLSDVVVAQNRVELCVWYSIEHPDRVTVVPIKGEVEGIERTGDKTEVVVDEGNTTVAYSLDEYLIEFGTAMEDENYDRACDLLEQIALTPETEAMWRTLSGIALQELKLYIAERCFAALGDVAKAHALHRINQLAEQIGKDTGGNGYEHYSVRAELCLLNKEFRKAEQIYLENGQVEKAMSMWEEVQKFSDAIAVGEARGHPDVPAKRAQYFNWLKETGQFEKAGEVRERESKYSEAIELYLRGGTPARAANVVATHGVKPEPQLLEAIASALFKAQIFEKAGDLFEKLGMNDRSIDAFRKGHVYSRAVELAKRAFPQQVTALEDSWGDYLVAQKLVDQAINHFIEAHQYNKAVTAAISSRQWGKAVNILESQMMGSANDQAVKGYFKQVAQHYEEGHQWSDAEKYYIKAGAVNEAVEMYNRAGLADHMYRVAQRHLKQDQIVSLFVAQAKQLEARGDYADAERIFIKVDEPDQAILMYKKARDFTNMIRLVSQYRPDFLLKTHLSLAAGFEKEGNVKLAEQHYVSGKDWGKAVNMYRDRDLWDDAVRVAKIHGGANASKQVVLTRAMNVDAEEGVRLLIKYGLVDAGIESALESQKFDVALQWAQLAMPTKLPYVHLKQAMHFEDQGEFRLAEEAFIRSSKPREAIDMYIHQHEFDNAMRVAEAHDIGAIPIICSAQARMSFAAGNYAEAEQLLLRANQAELLVKFFREASMFDDALRVAKEHAPEKVAEITRDAARTSTDPVKAGSMLEGSGDYPLAIDAYLRVTKDHVADVNQLVALWSRAVKLSINHARHLLRDTLRVATAKMTDAGRFVEAGKCLEEGEDYKGAVNVYAKGKKWDLATQLAKRISPELEEYVKRMRVQMAIEDNSAESQQDLDSLDPDAAIKAHVATNSWDKVMALARHRGVEEARNYSAMYVQYLTKEGNLRKALEVVDRDGVDPGDIRFFGTWVNFAEALANAMPDSNLNVGSFHNVLCDVVANMSKLGQPPDSVKRAEAYLSIIHAYITADRMHEMSFDDYAVKVISALPRYVGFIPADKAYFEAGMAARRYGSESIAFVFLNRFLDITEKIEDNEPDSSSMDHSDFVKSDFPTSFALPKRPTVPPASYEEANKWVLSISIQKELNPSLPIMTIEGAEIYAGCLKTPKGTVFEPCAVTGFPILQPKMRVKCKQCHRPANQEDWNKYVMQSKMCPWCGSQQSPDFKFKE